MEGSRVKKQKKINKVTKLDQPACDNHVEVQHRDSKLPWCNACGWRGARPARPAVPPIHHDDMPSRVNVGRVHASGTISDAGFTPRPN